jgi:hypothetical protein
MLGDILQLVSLVKEFTPKKKELNREYFNSFIHPAWELFSKIHEDYISSIRKYSDMLLKSEVTASSLIAEIRQDLILTQNLRIELGKMLGNFPFRYSRFLNSIETVPEENIPILVFMDAIYRYFQSQTELYCGDRWDKDYVPTNEIRMPMLVYLSGKGKLSDYRGVTRKDAARYFEYITQDIQNKYGEVAQAYYELKKLLLT